MEPSAEFLAAIKRGDKDVVTSLIAAHPELLRLAGDGGKTGLHWAAELDQAEVAQILVDAGSDIEARASWGASPLDWAATMGSARAAKFLLSRGASGFNLIIAAGLGKLTDVAAMVESPAGLTLHRRRGAPSAPDNHWPSDSAHILGDVLSDALYGAARNGHTDVVEYLLRHGASVNAKGVFGGTALHWAAMNGHAGTVDLLVARGANLMIEDTRFRATPEAWAVEGGHTEIAASLRHARESISSAGSSPS